MDAQYQLGKRQEFFRRAVKDLAQKRIAPLADRVDGSPNYPRELLDLLAQSRLLGLLVPKEQGGEAAGVLDLCVALEELSRTCAASAILCSTQNVAERLILSFGSNDQRMRLPHMALGKSLCGLSLAEPVGLKVSKLPKLTADSGRRVVSGSVSFAANADVANVLILPVESGPGCSYCLLDRQAAGIVVTRRDGMLGGEGRYACEVTLDACAVAEQDMLGEEGQGIAVTRSVLPEVSCAAAARAVGLAQSALDHALTYARDRVQFGRPIGRFQAIQVMLADMATRTEAARGMVYRAASLVDVRSSESLRLAIMAKITASDAAMITTTDAVQVLGGYGYMRDYPVERLMRNAKLCQMAEISNDAARVLLATELLA